MEKRFAIFVSGLGSNMEVLLKNYQKGKLLARPDLVITDNLKSPALMKAKEYSICHQYIPWKDGEEAEKKSHQILQGFGIDFLVLAGFLKILKFDILQYFSFRILNIHPSLLPNFPGLNAQKQALDARVKFSGCTTHFVTKKVDQGPIILQEKVSIHVRDDLESLSKRILQKEHEILSKTVNLFASDSLEIQNENQVFIHWKKWKSYKV